MNTYWDGNGQHQTALNRLYAKLVPTIGKASTVRGELLRVANNLYNEMHDNDGCNIRNGDYTYEVGFLLKHQGLLPATRKHLPTLCLGRITPKALEDLMDEVIETVDHADFHLETISGDHDAVFKLLDEVFI